MNKFVSTLLLALVFHTTTLAQNDYGFLNFVNLVPGETLCEIRIESKNPSGDGLRSGANTGWFMFPDGPASVSIKIAGHGNAKGTLQIKEGTGALVAIYLQDNEEASPPKPPKLRIKSFPTIAAEGLTLRLISLCPSPNRFELGSHAVEVERFEITEIPKWTGASFLLRRNGTDIKKIPAMREKEPFYLLTGTDPAGNHTTALVYAGPVKAPPWRQKKTPEDEP